MLIPVILSGGSGTRLWPLSRADYPKQFLNLVGEGSLLQQTVRRAELLDVEDVIVVSNDKHRFIVAEQLQDLDVGLHIITEPVARNTASAIAVASQYALKEFDENVELLIMPSDHYFEDHSVWIDAVRAAKANVEKGDIVTFGVTPTSASSDYGYIKVAQESRNNLGKKIDLFVEKPSPDRAAELIESGEYLWNCGIFYSSATTLLLGLSRHSSDMLRLSSDSVEMGNLDFGFLRLQQHSFGKLESISFDHAVMEKTDRGVVFEIDCHWSDLGNWSSLKSTYKSSDKNNVFVGDVRAIHSSNNFVHVNSKLVVAIGINDIIVIDTKDAILLASSDQIHKLGTLVNDLVKESRPEVIESTKVYRPWGYFESLVKGDNFQIKKISVKPGGRLSLQTHQHRSEHWMVLAGVATVFKEEEVFELSKDEYTYIEKNAKHSLHNTTDDQLEIIEIQSGTYLGEDDIVRIQDFYGRN